MVAQKFFVGDRSHSSWVLANSYDDGFGPYQEGEDEIAGIYDTPDEFEAAMYA